MIGVIAGKYESTEEGQSEENIKYADEFHTMEQALDAVKGRGLLSYHFCWIEIGNYRVHPNDVRRKL